MDPLLASALAGAADISIGPRVALQVAANDAPLVSTLIQRGATMESSPEFKIANDQLVTARTQVDSGAHDENTTAITVDSTNGFLVNDVVYFEATGELGLVTAITSGTVLTVQRGTGSTTAVAGSVANNAYIRVVGNAAGEGATPGSASGSAPDLTDQYCQTIRTAVNMTGRADRTPTKTEPERARQRAIAMRRHMRELEAAVKFSAIGTSTDAGGRTVYHTDGLYRVLNGSLAIGGTVSKADITAIARDSSEQGASEKLVFAGPTALGALNDLYADQAVFRPMDSAIGLSVVRLIHSFGEWTIVLDRSLQGGQAGDMLVIDPDFAMLKHSRVDDRGHGGLPHILENVVQDGRDGSIDEVVSECGLDYVNESAHYLVTGITGAAA